MDGKADADESNIVLHKVFSKAVACDIIVLADSAEIMVNLFVCDDRD